MSAPLLSLVGSDERLEARDLAPVHVVSLESMEEMPAFAETDDIVASVLTFIRREWGHGADPVEAALVGRVRAATRARPGPWTAAELRSAYP